jgi:hypothetical protein
VARFTADARSLRPPSRSSVHSRIIPRATRPSSPDGVPGASTPASASSASALRPAIASPIDFANHANAATHGSFAVATAVVACWIISGYDTVSTPRMVNWDAILASRSTGSRACRSPDANARRSAAVAPATCPVSKS